MREALKQYIQEQPINKWIPFHPKPNHIFDAELFDAVNTGNALRLFEIPKYKKNGIYPTLEMNSDWSAFKIVQNKLSSPNKKETITPEYAEELGFKESDKEYAVCKINNSIDLELYNMGSKDECLELYSKKQVVPLRKFHTHGNITKEELKSLTEILKKNK